MTGSAENDVTTWRYKTWGGRKATVVAHSVEFTPTHVVWRDSNGSVVVAERPENANEIAQVGTLGSSTRGVRPGVPEEMRPVTDKFECYACVQLGNHNACTGIAWLPDIVCECPHA